MLDFAITALSITGMKAFAPDYFNKGAMITLGANPDAGDVFLGKMRGKGGPGSRIGVGKYADETLRGNNLNKIKGTRISWFNTQSQILTDGNAGGFSGRGQMQHMSPMAKNPAGAFMGSAMSLVGIGMSAYFAYQGYQEDGIRGAGNAIIYDLAVGSALATSMVDQKNIVVKAKDLSESQRKLVRAGLSLGDDAPIKGKFAFTRTSMRGIPGVLAKGLTASIGASVGQAVGGTPGAFVGAFAATRVPLPIALAGIAVGGLVASTGSKIFSSGMQALQKGIVKRRMKTRIDTAGDTAAFFTNNANTMRQRSVMAMRRSHLNARSALGMEASMSHVRRGYF